MRRHFLLVLTPVLVGGCEGPRADSMLDEVMPIFFGNWPDPTPSTPTCIAENAADAMSPFPPPFADPEPFAMQREWLSRGQILIGPNTDATTLASCDHVIWLPRPQVGESRIVISYDMNCGDQCGSSGSTTFQLRDGRWNAVDEAIDG